MSRLATRGSDPIDLATIRGYILNRLRQGAMKAAIQRQLKYTSFPFCNGVVCIGYVGFILDINQRIIII